MRTDQQRIGDGVEQAALDLAKPHFPKACLTKGSGAVYKDGDLAGVGALCVECKGSGKAGKGLRIDRRDWDKVKHQARGRLLIPVHVGVDHDGELVALIPFADLIMIEAADEASVSNMEVVDEDEDVSPDHP